MTPTRLSKSEWAEVRKAVEAGLSLQEAARAYGLEHETVRKRAQRESWVTNAVREKMLCAAKERLSQVCPTKANLPSSEEVVALTLAQKGETLRHLALQLSEKGLKKAISADLDVKDWQDAKLAWEIGAKAAGLDKGEGASVTVLFGAPPEDAAAPVHVQEAEVVDAEDLAELE